MTEGVDAKAISQEASRLLSIPLQALSRVPLRGTFEGISSLPSLMGPLLSSSLTHPGSWQQPLAPF